MNCPIAFSSFLVLYVKMTDDTGTRAVTICEKFGIFPAPLWLLGDVSLTRNSGTTPLVYVYRGAGPADGY
jgi:hypothetical protein